VAVSRQGSNLGTRRAAWRRRLVKRLSVPPSYGDHGGMLARLADELAEVHRRLNVLLIEKAPALDHSDVELAHDFLDSLGEFIRLLRPLPGASAEQIRAEIADTADPALFISDIPLLNDSYARTLACNAMLRKRYQEVVFGEG